MRSSASNENMHKFISKSQKIKLLKKQTLSLMFTCRYSFRFSTLKLKAVETQWYVSYMDLNSWTYYVYQKKACLEFKKYAEIIS